MKRFLNRKMAFVVVIFGILGSVFGGLGIADAATSTTTPPPARIGCVYGPDRMIDQAYENPPANFKCTKGFAVSLSTSGTAGKTGAVGPAGPKGDTGATGATGAAGADGLTGAYYAVAKYDVGDTNGGAVATVACKETTDVAISGGVQTLALGTNGLAGNVPVSSSFPGRMDWDTNTPIAGRLDGWIVQFGGNSSSTSLGDPHYVDIYALCVPGADVPVDTTFVESAS